MKCKSCGVKVKEQDKICLNCGFDLEEFKKKKRIIVEEDPDVDETKKTDVIDMPILAFVFGILAVLSSLLFVAKLNEFNFVILYFALVILFNFLTFYLANKPARVKYRPFAKVGKGFAYFSIGFIILKIVYDLLGLLFFY